MLHLSTALANKLAKDGGIQSAMNLCFLYLYSGTIPADADVAASGATKIVKISNNGGATGMTFNSTPANGVVSGNCVSETWKGTAIATGAVSFYRLCIGSDDGSGAAGGSDYRIQGTVGANISYDLLLSSLSITTGDNVPIDSFQYQIQR